MTIIDTYIAGNALMITDVSNNNTLSGDDNTFRINYFRNSVINYTHIWVHEAAYNLTAKTSIWLCTTDVIDSIYKESNCKNCYKLC